MENKIFGLMDIVGKEDEGKALIKYDGFDWNEIDLKEWDCIFLILWKEVEKVLSDLPDMELEAMRQHTDISQFFNLAAWILTEEQVAEQFKWFTVEKLSSND